MIIKITYAQRIELGQILSDNTTEDSEKLLSAIECVFNRRPNVATIQHYAKRFENICETMKHWIDCEQKMLAYTPTADEINAGFNDLKTTTFGTAIDLAERFGVLPQTILDMDYEDIFSILWHTKEMKDYEERLYKIKNSKR